MSTGWSRRDFLGSLAGTAAAPWLWSACAQEGAEEGPRSGVADGFTFDLHTHPGSFYQRGLPGYVGDDVFVARVEDMVAGGMTGAFVSLVADVALLERTESGIRQAREFEPGQAWDDYRRQLDQLRQLFAGGAADARLVTELSAADAARAAGDVAAFVAVEGGDFLGGEVGRLSSAYSDGVRSVQLVHYAQNELGDLQTQPPVFGGLSPFGAEVVDAMVELGMVIDVAHAAFPTVEAVVGRVDVPIILSHSLLAGPDRSHPRLISEDHARLVAGTGGVIGMWPSGYGSGTLNEFIDHTLRMVDVVGIDHVGLGTDMDGNYLPVIAGYGDYGAWTRGLGDRGLSAEEVAKLAGGNARRVLEAVL